MQLKHVFKIQGAKANVDFSSLSLVEFKKITALYSSHNAQNNYLLSQAEKRFFVKSKHVFDM